MPADKPVMPADKPAVPAEKPAAPTPPPPAGGILGPDTLKPDPAIPPVPPTKPISSIEPANGESGVLTVWVPNDAKVTINGLLTKSTGSKRQFVSYGLLPGYSYRYVVKAEVVFNGKVYEESNTVSLSGGERGGVAFGFVNMYRDKETLAQSP
jgi:uncharacterized protein (TIGR03000 family)